MRLTSTILAITAFILLHNVFNRQNESQRLKSVFSQAKHIKTIKKNINKEFYFNDFSETQQVELLVSLDESQGTSKNAYILNQALHSKSKKVSDYASNILNDKLENLTNSDLEHFVSNNIYSLSDENLNALCRNQKLSSDQKLRISYILNKVDKKIDFKACRG